MTIPVPVSALPSLSLATSVGPGATVDFVTAKLNVSMAVVVSGSITSGLVGMEASHDGAAWIPHTVIDVTTGLNQGVDNRSGAYRYWRSTVVAEIVGGTVSATFMEAG
jgi:hypothetical protein